MNKKQCSVCNKVKVITNFSWKLKKKGLRQHHCKACQRHYNADHYQSNKADYVDKVMVRSENNKKFIFCLKDNKPCQDCNQKFRHYVLDFDHRDPKTKVAGIAQMYTWSKEAILAEIDKCDLVCANCHRERTFRRVGRAV